jgi:hypothetical protein
LERKRKMKSVMTRNGILLICLIFTFFAWPAQVQSGFLQVTGPCRLSFPSDHGSHPDYRTEWWYYTGNLTDGGHRRFGFQLTFFRSGLQPPGHRSDWPEPASSWRTDQIYLAHAAISDITGGRHLQAERMARPVLSMAGAQQTDAALPSTSTPGRRSSPRKVIGCGPKPLNLPWTWTSLRSNRRYCTVTADTAARASHLNAPAAITPSPACRPRVS